MAATPVLQELVALKEQWGVSIAAIMKRAEQLGLVSHDAYKRFNMAERNLTTEAGMYAYLADRFAKGAATYDFAVVDEAQDISVPQLRFLAALGGEQPNSLFFAGDLG